MDDVRRVLAKVKEASKGREPRSLLGIFTQVCHESELRIRSMRALAGSISRGGYVGSLSPTWPAQYLIEWTQQRGRTKEDVQKALRDAIKLCEPVDA